MKLNLKWLQWLWPFTVRVGDKKSRILTFGMNFFIYFFLIHLYWWIAGIDPVRKYWFEPLLPSLESKLSVNEIKQQELHRWFYLLEGQTMYPPDLRMYMDNYTELRIEEMILKRRIKRLSEWLSNE